MPTLLRLLPFFAAFVLVGCDLDSRPTLPEERIGTYDPNGDAGLDTTYGDAGVNAGFLDASFAGGDASAALGDAGTSSADTDAGAVAPNMGCMVDACGAMPATTPGCFDGALAVVSCEPFADGVCTWQFRCGE